MRAQTNSDMIEVMGDALSGPVVPQELRGLRPDELRFDGTSIIAGTSRSQFAIDPSGTKHLPEMADAAWPVLTVPFDAELRKDQGGNWALASEVTLPADVDAERRRRVRMGFTFEGVVYQSDAEAMENIAGASTSAIGAQQRGHGAGDLRWFDPDADFVWIAADNSMNPMDAPTMESFGNAAMAHMSAHIFAARALKAMDPIPANFTDPAYWP